jgi:hypothetical protein
LFRRSWCGGGGGGFGGSGGWRGRRCLGWGANGRFTDENGTRLDRQGLGFQVTNDFGTGLEVDAVGGGHVAMDLAIDDDGAGFDFRFEAGVFADRKVSVGIDFAFDPAIDHQVIGEFHGAFDFHIRGKHVAGGGGRGTGGSRCGSGLLLMRAVSRRGWGCKWLRMAGFRMGRGGTLGFAVVLADYFFKHGGEEWLELLGCQIRMLG